MRAAVCKVCYNSNMSEQIIDGLNTMLSDTYILYIKTQNFHWNVTGPNFGPLHKMFEDQYIELRDAVDEIAERVRALGAFALGSCTDFKEHSNLSESVLPKFANEMIEELSKDHTSLAEEAKKFASKLSELDDEVTAHLVLERAMQHQKTAWMLQSHLER